VGIEERLDNIEAVQEKFLNVLAEHEEAFHHAFAALSGMIVKSGAFTNGELVEYMEALNVDTGAGTNRLVDGITNFVLARAIEEGSWKP
jgi:hypothetical protein